MQGFQCESMYHAPHSVRCHVAFRAWIPFDFMLLSSEPAPAPSAPAADDTRPRPFLT